MSFEPKPGVQGAALYQRIRNDLEARIMSGAWPPGHRVPFEHELMETYSCSRMTVNKVLSALFADPSLVRREMVDDVLRFMRGDGVPAALRSLAGDAFPDGRQRLVLRDVIASTAAPVQIIWGEEDGIIPCTHSKGLAAQATVRILPNSGHMAHLEKAGLVNEWLAQVMMAADSRETY